jgi:ligand-binding sensor domain-containing protein/serine phosphatase RsbU (regulator of sigma subunit)
MKKKLFQLFLLATISLSSQSYHFLHLTVEEGLSENQVFDLIQDRRGSIWMATLGGVSIYDGLGFTTLNDSSGLPSNIINCLYEDVKGDIWIGTHKGLAVYDGIEFHTFTQKDGLPSNVVKSICEDGFGRLWIGTQYGGLCMLDNFSKKKKIFIPYEIDFGGRGKLSVNKVIETPDAKIYIGTNQGLAEIFNGEIKTYTTKDGLKDNIIYDLEEDVNGDIWIGTASGLSLFSNGGVITNIKIADLSEGAVKTLEQDKNDNIWIGTLNAGVIRLNINTYDYKIFNEDNGLSEDLVLSILEDKHDNIWVGTKGGGINKITRSSFTYLGVKEGLPNEKINGLIQDSKNNFWFATRGGIIKYNESDSVPFTLFNKRSGIPVDYITTVFEDKANNIWVGTLLGIVKIKNNKIEKIYSVLDGVMNPVTCFFEDQTGTIWIGTEGGLGKLIGDKIRFYRMFDGLSDGKISSITQDKSGKLWIGTKSGGINWFNGIEFGHINEDDGLIPSNFINCMIRGPRGGIFIGTNSGITKFDENRNTYKTFNTSNCKLSSDNIKMMLFDEDNQLWIGTKEGLDRISFNPPQITRQTGEHISEVKHFSKSDGIAGGQINGNAICEDSDGNLWFGTNKGAIKHDLSVDNSSEIQPQTFFTGLELENKTTNWSLKNYEIEPWSKIPKNLVLPYDSSTLTFHFADINYNNSSGTIYKSILKRDGEIFTPEKVSDERKRDFTKLPPGEYDFQVYACNKDDEDYSNQLSPSVFSFVVSPPFWAEIWFIIFVSLIIIFSIIFFIKYREKKLKEERELLEEKVKERTEEVLEKNKELESVNIEMAVVNKEIEEKNNDLNSSIRYALTIQKASFPSLQELYNELPNSFIYHLPRDIVSGDFYWYRKTNDKFVIACADCTGHGVPGALTSMIGIALLNEIVGGNKITDPSKVLELLDNGIIKAFENSESETNDGMDISLITIDKINQTIEYSGAYRPLIMIRNNELFEYKPTKMSIGFKDVKEKAFEKTTLKFEEGDCFFMYSDGYPDQFGGPRNKKFKTRTLKEMLINGSANDMLEQKNNVQRRFKEWMGDKEQIDDILIMGFKF